MKISIAMATFNGARYLQEQLDSFAAQTRLPDELLVCDDMSSDQTLEVLQKFARNAPFTTKIIRNERNFGYTKNFEKALVLCDGDVVFLSDQDDVWCRHKVETVSKMFESDSAIMVVNNNAEIVDQTLRATGRTLFSNARSVGYKSPPTYGSCTTVRSSVAQIVVPIPEHLLDYDLWINIVAGSCGVRSFVPEVLQKYRRHEENSTQGMISATKKPTIFEILKEYGLRDVTEGWTKEVETREFLEIFLKQKRAALEVLGLYEVAEESIHRERKTVDAIKKRIELVRSPRVNRLRKIVRFLKAGGYRQFSGWRSAFKDVIR